MQFRNVAALSALLAGAAIAAPAPAVPSGFIPFDGYASGTLLCTPESSVCTIACGEDLQDACTLVAVFDSVFYGLEVLAGADITCTNSGCVATCPEVPSQGTALCTLEKGLATFDSVFAVGESIVISNSESILGQFGDLSNTPDVGASNLPSLPLPSLGL
jgi:hypothetical protein